METREALRQRRDIARGDIDDIIGIASELQDADAPGASVADVEAVAEELRIEARYVEQAIEVLRQRRAQAVVDERRQGERTRRALLIGGGALGITGLGVVGLAGIGGRELSGARQDLALAEADLDTVLQRQASLAPQLVALAGGDVAGLADLAAEVGSAATLSDRLAASDALAVEMAIRLGQLPGTVDPDVRLNLHHEVTGIQNRISVERRRYETARVAHEGAGGLARGLGCGG